MRTANKLLLSLDISLHPFQVSRQTHEPMTIESWEVRYRLWLAYRKCIAGINGIYRAETGFKTAKLGGFPGGCLMQNQTTFWEKTRCGTPYRTIPL